MAGFLLRNAYVLLFAASLFEQLGAPLPSSPLLLGAGALARDGEMALPEVVAISVLASLLGHAAWFFAGRRRGASVLRLLCRISIEPDSCVRRTENLFARRGALALIAAPWVPGLALIAPPLAGMSRMSWRRFLALDALGALLWALVFSVVGFIFGRQIAEGVMAALRLGSWFALAAGLALGVWLGWKIAQRQRLRRDLAVSRAEPEALVARLGSETAPLIVDVRHELDIEATPSSLPGAVVVGMDELGEWAGGVSRDREIILTCD